MISFKKLIKAKWIFKKPNKKKILIYDSMTEERGFAQILFSKKNYQVLDTRYESINLYVILKIFLNFKFKNIRDNYKKTFIQLVSPKIVYTAIDNNLAFFKLKDLYKKPTYISDQNGMSKISNAFWPNSFYWESKTYTKIKKKKPRADIIFLFGKNEKERISPIINGKIYTLGNTVNNNFPLKVKKVKKKITSMMFISSGLFSAVIKHEQLIFSHINKFCIKKNIKLIFCSRLGKSGEDLHRKIFAKGDWIYLPHVGTYANYRYLNKLQMVVFAHSTFGFEALAKGLRCSVFYSHFPDKSSHSMYPKSGPFWTNFLKYKDFEKVLNRTMNFTNQRWRKIVEKYSPEIMYYDKSNIIKKKIIKNVLFNSKKSSKKVNKKKK